MPVMARLDTRSAPRGLMPWRVAVWLLLLLAGFGCVQYLMHAQLLWAQRARVSAADAGALNQLLAWDVGYFAAAFVLIVLCAGCILRQGWARAPLRVACAALALWMLASGGMMLARWSQFDQASADALTQFGADAKLHAAVAHARRVYRITLGLKALAVPFLGWLVWRLDTPAARAQFRRRH
ncbi:MAG: hypothetical protein EPN56_05245 [Rhodanobacter sp.]|nr:MAG: hypothetical protein EPN78_01570 [Rhodanobacter sp.]TAM15147.1 MAG: hypothetical protein EPN66_00940 [Rhodanobacter sp.]TAM36383.1 MAG: hypothetical protein EPN56_05245 [Rhodanobacter sp.]